MEVQKNLAEEDADLPRQPGERNRVLDFNEHRKEQSLQKHGRFIYSEKVA